MYSIKFIIISFLVISSLYAKDKRVTLQLKWKHQFQFAGYYAALHKGYYKEEGLDVLIKEATTDLNVVEEVLSNNAQFGIGTNELVLDFAKNKSIKILGVIFQHSPLSIISLNNNIKNIHDLVGKKIMIENGASDIYALLKRENIDINSLKILPHTININDLIEHRVDAITGYSINEPFNLAKKGLHYNIFSPRAAGIDFYGDNLFTSNDMINLNSEIVEKFRRASFKGWQYAMSNQDEIIEIIMKNYNSQHKIKEHYQFEAKKMMELIYPDIVEIGYINKGRWEHIINVYKELGLLNQDINLKKFLYIPDKTFWEEYKYLIFIVLFFILLLFLVGFIAYYIYKINLKLKKSEQRHKIIFQNSATAILIWKKGYIITDWNYQSTKLFGWNANEVIGKNFMNFLVPEIEKSDIDKYLDSFLKNSDLHIFTNENLMKNGSLITCEWYNTILPSFENEEDFEVLSLVMDITQKLENEKVLKQLANYDSLTDLPNRYYFETILEKIYSLSNRNNSIFGLAFIDLDGFKTINDTYGHHAGDFVLKNIAQRFQESVRKEDTIARIGGDEFALIFHLSDGNENYKNFLNKLLNIASIPIKYTDEITLKVTASIGLSFYSSQNKVSIQELIKQADDAMYNAKKNGKNIFAVYNFKH
ncbi:ABC transporter substrate-binding protein [Arcobacter aquimarinus]|uniref:ABC transporter substrate-binding protein n=1 Tax=Arcobacter aquimarinus TaxID=1315211 RepID=UPI003BB0EBE7